MVSIQPANPANMLSTRHWTVKPSRYHTPQLRKRKKKGIQGRSTATIMRRRKYRRKHSTLLLCLDQAHNVKRAWPTFSNGRSLTPTNNLVSPIHEVSFTNAGNIPSRFIHCPMNLLRNSLVRSRVSGFKIAISYRIFQPLALGYSFPSRYDVAFR